VAISLVTDAWPVCFVRIDGDQTLEEYEQYIAAFNRLYERQQPFAIVTRILTYRSNREIIARTGRWFKETEPLIQKWWVSNAMVSESTGFRFLLSAVFLIKPLPIPYAVTATVDDALRFTREKWQARGLPALPASLRSPV
jgi:hypothetical protein